MSTSCWYHHPGEFPTDIEAKFDDTRKALYYLILHVVIWGLHSIEKGHHANLATDPACQLLSPRQCKTFPMCESTGQFCADYCDARQYIALNTNINLICSQVYWCTYYCYHSSDSCCGLLNPTDWWPMIEMLSSFLYNPYMKLMMMRTGTPLHISHLLSWLHQVFQWMLAL
jgi:hypothetical protein